LRLVATPRSERKRTEKAKKPSAGRKSERKAEESKLKRERKSEKEETKHLGYLAMSGLVKQKKTSPASLLLLSRSACRDRKNADADDVVVDRNFPLLSAEKEKSKML
jgi:hypothetical protein